MGTPPELKVPLQMMAHDVGKWRDCGTHLSQASQRANALKVPLAGDFSFLGVGAGLPGYYEGVRQLVEVILRSGASFSTTVADKLGALRKEFMTDDQEACELIERSGG